MYGVHLKSTGHQGIVDPGLGQDGEVDVEESDVDADRDDCDGRRLEPVL
jgi:hypothetical protein